MSAATQERTLAEHRAAKEAAEQNGSGDDTPAEGDTATPAPADPPTTPPVDKADLEGDGDDEQGPLFELELEGDAKLDTKVGGKKPEKATVKLRGGSIGIPKGQYEKGDTVTMLVKVRCAEVHFVDKEDGTTGEIIETERRHIFKVKHTERIKD